MTNYKEDIMQESIIEQIEFERKNQEINLKRAEALWRLLQNEDFKTVFNDYYQGLYLQRLVKEDLALAVTDTVKQSAVSKIQAIGLFGQFIRALDQQGLQAKAFINASEEELIRAYEENQE